MIYAKWKYDYFYPLQLNILKLKNIYNINQPPPVFLADYYCTLIAFDLFYYNIELLKARLSLSFAIALLVHTKY